MYIRNTHLQEASFARTFNRNKVAPLNVMPPLYLLKLSNVKSILPGVLRINSLKGIPWQWDVAGGPHWEKEEEELKIKKMQLIIFKPENIKRSKNRAISSINAVYIKIKFQ
jgi:hypothetical protein